MGSILFLILFQIFIFTRAENDQKLIFVTVMHRHGDRTPINPYPNDPYSNISYWPEGWAQLTKTGKMQMYELGEWLRNRYDNFLPKKYSSNDIYVLSSDKDRTIMSALCVLSSLYYPVNEDIWNTNLLWQPIPVHTIPKKYDSMIAYDKSCPRYNVELKCLLEDKNVQKKLSEMVPLLNYIYKSINVNYTSIVKKIGKFINIYDNLFVQTTHGLEIPKWAKSIYPKEMEPYFNYVFKLKYYSTKIQRLLSGQLLNEIIDRFYKKSNNTLLPDRKMWIYSIHDSTIISFLNSMGYRDSDEIMPGYGSTLLLELYEIKNEYYVTLFYKKGKEEPKKMSMLDCDILCPLHKLKTLLEPLLITPDELEKECQDVPVPFAFTIVSIILICFISLLLLSTLIFCFCRKYIKEKFSCCKCRVSRKIIDQ